MKQINTDSTNQNKPLMSTDKNKVELIHKEITEKIIKAAYKVHNVLGPGYLESIYQNALIIELQSMGFKCDTEKLVKIFYSGHEIGEHRLDLIIEEKLLLN